MLRRQSIVDDEHTPACRLRDPAREFTMSTDAAHHVADPVQIEDHAATIDLGSSEPFCLDSPRGSRFGVNIGRKRGGAELLKIPPRLFDRLIGVYGWDSK